MFCKGSSPRRNDCGCARRHWPSHNLIHNDGSLAAGWRKASVFDSRAVHFCAGNYWSDAGELHAHAHAQVWRFGPTCRTDSTSQQAATLHTLLSRASRASRAAKALPTAGAPLQYTAIRFTSASSLSCWSRSDRSHLVMLPSVAFIRLGEHTPSRPSRRSNTISSGSPVSVARPRANVACRPSGPLQRTLLWDYFMTLSKPSLAAIAGAEPKEAPWLFALRQFAHVLLLKV